MKKTKLLNLIIAIISVVILVFILSFKFDFYYDLNDDVLMKDILSGAYTGVPESKNIQMLWLLSAFISLFYRINARVPWYGLFLCLCQFGSIAIIIGRSLKAADDYSGTNNNDSYNNKCYRNIVIKLCIALAELLLFAALMLKHLVFVQYTITVAFLSGAAVIWFTTCDFDDESAGRLIRQNIPTFILIFIAFLLRSEMLLLMLPFICVAGVCAWSLERKVFSKESIIKYLSVIGIILLSLGIGFFTNLAAYGQDEWKEFVRLFDARTQLYDFAQVPEYEGNAEFYDGLGLKPEDVELLINYNYGVSDKITADTMEDIAEYALGLKKGSIDYKEKLLSKLKLYAYEVSHIKGEGTDRPYNIAAGLMYAFFIAAAIIAYRKQGGDKKDVKITSVIWKLALLLIVRSAIWLYILMKDRAPERITHSLYLIEICVLLGLLIREIKHIPYEKLIGIGAQDMTLVVMLVILPSVFVLINAYKETDVEYKRRENVNVAYSGLYAWINDETDKDNDRLYLMDVYSSVAYSEKIFAHDANIYKPYDIMGGWACFSPLQKKKLEKYGNIDMAELLLNENVSFVCAYDISYDWIPEYYKNARGVDDIHIFYSSGSDRFGIYSISRLSE